MNVFQYAAITEENWLANLADMTDFRPQYTFYSDFSIEEFCEVYMGDEGAVEDTYNRVKEYWLSDIKSATEVALVLNHKIWSFYGGVDSSYLNCDEKHRTSFCDLYAKLYEDCVSHIEKTFAGDEDALLYYYRATD